MIFLFTGLGLNYKKGQGARCKLSQTQGTVPEGRRVDLVKPEGFLCKSLRMKGYGDHRAVGSHSDGPD
jgi:hypothetical protein